MIETHTITLNGKTRREIRNGRDYIVAPATMIVEGVLNGSNGSLLYPREEIARNPSAWNAIPIVHTHPVVNGVNVSARDPDVLDVYELGRVFRAHAQYGPLQSEAWFDVDLTRKIAPKVLHNLENGYPIELSTGLFTENVPAPSNSVFNGKPYTHIAKNYIPDHLAILPDDVGACSLKDGCGLLIGNKDKCDTCNRTDNAFCPTGPGGGQDPTCGSGSAKKVGPTLSSIKDSLLPHLESPGEKTVESVASKSGMNPAAVQAVVSRMYLSGHITKTKENKFRVSKNAKHVITDILKSMGLTDNSDSNWSEVSFQTDNAFCPTGDGGGVDPTCSPGGGSGGSHHPSVVSAIKKILSRIPPNYPTPTADQMEMKAGDEYFNDGMGLGKHFKNFKDAKKAVRKAYEEKAHLTSNEEIDMDRKKTINWLTSNCDCWKGQEKTLETYKDETLSTLQKEAEKAKNNEAVANAAREGFGGSFKDLTTNELVEKLKSSKLEAEEEEEETPKPTPKSGKKGKKPAPTKNKKNSDPDDSDTDDDEEEEEEEETKVTTANKKPATDEDWLKGAPAGIQSAVRNAMAVEKREKVAVVSKLVANIKDAEKKNKRGNELLKKPLSELNELLELLPESTPTDNNQHDFSKPVPVYFGDPGNPNPVSNQEVDSSDILEMPNMDYAEIEATRNNRKRKAE